MIMGAIKYGGLLGKTKAIYGKRITNVQLNELKNKPTVSDIASLLKSHPGYADLLSDLSERNLTRESFEEALIEKLHSDFVKIFNFTSSRDQAFLQYYVIQSEIKQILKYIRLILAGDTVRYNYVPQTLFKRLSRVDYSTFTTAKTFSEFVDLLEKTPYYPILSPYKKKAQLDYSHIEVTLQTYFFTTLFELIKSNVGLGDAKNIKNFTKILIDLLNFTNILRCIAVGQDRQTIYGYLLPFTSDPKSQKIINEMINTQTYAEALSIVRNSSYGKYFKSEEEKKYIEFYYWEYVYGYAKDILSKASPSLTLIYAYLWYKEIEIANLVHIIEAKNYHLSGEEIDQYLIGLKKAR